MRVAITGCAGGIGRFLAKRLQLNSEVIGIVRALPGPERAVSNVRYVTSGDNPESHAELRQADVVLHAAVDMRVLRRGPFLAANRQLDETILHHALSGKCRLFVYFSSMVVYSGSEPADENGYREDQPIHLASHSDPYTQLKIEGETRVIEACRKAGVDYVILRPTIVTGSGLNWSDKLYKFYRYFPVGVVGAVMNIVHVEDLCRQVEALLKKGPRNEIFNLGSVNIETKIFFESVGRIVGRRSLLISRKLVGGLGFLLPSALWFFQKRALVNCEKISKVTGIGAVRSVAGHFSEYHQPVERNDILEALKVEQCAAEPFRAYGCGYFYVYNSVSALLARPVFVREHRGVVSLEEERVTVRAGTRISELSNYLDRHDRTLATLPEFGGISVGACFFVEVHGSSTQHFSLYDLIEEIKYLDPQGNVVVSSRNEEEWAELRRRNRNFILLELTFRTRNSGYLSNRLEWRSDQDLEDILVNQRQMNFSTTVQWYPNQQKLLVYNINEVDGPAPGALRAIVPYRGLPFRLQKLLISLKTRGRPLQIDRYHKILTPWTKIQFEPFIKWLVLRKGNTVQDVEVCIGLADGLAFVSALRETMQRGESVFGKIQGLGIRFSFSPQTKQVDLWIELFCDDPVTVGAFIALIRKTCNRFDFHRGKTIAS